MKSQQIIFSIWIFLAQSLALWSGQPRAITENGYVIGKVVTTSHGLSYLAFEGIPYAKPPVGDKRFKEAERLDSDWIGDWNATSPGSDCLQLDHFSREEDSEGNVNYQVIGEEDCLFLNIYTQATTTINKDVFVAIHGGAFMFGSGHRYGCEYLLESSDIIHVNINYRLGPLGFLSTGDNLVPGNNGLKDQVAALEWVQRNIAGFGGDPNKVTILGLSAGGASVHYHYLSPLSNGLFGGGYSYSGTALAPWALIDDAPLKTKQLAFNLGCPTTDFRTIVKCLRRRPARKIVEQVKSFQTWLYNPFTVFGPVVEVGSSRPFIDRHPRDLLRAGRIKDLPWITGITTEEGLYPAADFVDNEEQLQHLQDNWQAIAPSLLFYDGQKSSNIADRAKQLYFGQEEISKETAMKLVQMLGDRLFVAPAVEAAVLQARRNKQPVYLYQHRYPGVNSFSQIQSGTKKTFGVCHGDDIAYLIKFPGFDTRTTEREKAMADVLISILLHFSKTGSPPSSLNWEPLSGQNVQNVTILDIISPESQQMTTVFNLGKINNILDIFGENTWSRDEL